MSALTLSHHTNERTNPPATHANGLVLRRPVAGSGLAGNPRPTLIRSSTPPKTSSVGASWDTWVAELGNVAKTLRENFPHTAIVRAPAYALTLLRLREKELLAAMEVVTIEWEIATPWRQRRHPRLLPLLGERMAPAGLAHLQKSIDMGDWRSSPDGDPIIEYVKLEPGEYEWCEGESLPGLSASWSCGTVSLVP